MEKEQADFIVHAFEHSGYEAEPRRYSGRGMYGSETWAVVIDDVALLPYCITQYVADEDPDDFTIIPPLHSDNMGLQEIIY